MFLKHRMIGLYYLPECDKYINLNNVTYVKFDRKHLKIIFSYDYSIKIKNVVDETGEPKVIPDYTYYNFDDEENYENAVQAIINYVVTKMPSFKHFKENHTEFLINFNKVTFIKFHDGRAIINFNNSASFRDETGTMQVTGYFIYLDLTDKSYQIFKQKIDNNEFNLY